MVPSPCARGQARRGSHAGSKNKSVSLVIQFYGHAEGQDTALIGGAVAVALDNLEPGEDSPRRTANLEDAR